MPYKGVKESVENCNGYLVTGADKEFGRYLQKDAMPIAQTPFYAVRLWPKVHHTTGGLQIDKEARVISLEETPIKGPYAAGEVSGESTGQSLYPTNSSIPACQQ